MSNLEVNGSLIKKTIQEGGGADLLLEPSSYNRRRKSEQSDNPDEQQYLNLVQKILTTGRCA